jgi:fructosamine-3-kinase
LIDLFKHIASQNNLYLKEAKPLSGGDSNQVFLLKCEEGCFVAKINDADRFPKMFSVEAKGLQMLGETKSFKIPKVIAEGKVLNQAYLLLEFIAPGNKTTDFWNIFAQQLASLHRTSQNQFGLDHDNYIGSLPQYNGFCESAVEFYISQRLEPQLKLAFEGGFKFGNLKGFFKNISEEIPEESPSLIHGDLWSGNFLVAHNGDPALIDPAVAFAPREMDLAMMKLFGGFSEEVFMTYNSIFPLCEGWKERTAIWQLYYLLVHLNLFGSGYWSQVKFILKRYS